MLSLKKLLSKNGQISLEFSLLIMTVILAAVIVGYHMIETSLDIKNTTISTVNNTSNTIIQTLSTV